MTTRPRLRSDTKPQPEVAFIGGSRSMQFLTLTADVRNLKDEEPPFAGETFGF